MMQSAPRDIEDLVTIGRGAFHLLTFVQLFFPAPFPCPLGDHSIEPSYLSCHETGSECAQVALVLRLVLQS